MCAWDLRISSQGPREETRKRREPVSVEVRQNSEEGAIRRREGARDLLHTARNRDQHELCFEKAREATEAGNVLVQENVRVYRNHH